MDTPQSAPRIERLRRFALLVQRSRLLSGMVIALVRATRARFSAGVVGVVINDARQVLLVEHVFHPDHPWGLPGGWLNRGESPAAALQRELIEELDLRVTIHEPLLIEDTEYFRRHLDVAYRCTTRQPVGRLSAELLHYRWADRDDLPPLSAFHQQAIDLAYSRIAQFEQVEAFDR